MSNATSQTLSRLFEEIHLCRSEQEESAGAFAAPTTAIHPAAEALEQFWSPVYFVENDQLILMFGEVTLRVRELCRVGNGLEVQIEKRPGTSNFEGQSGLSNLARPKGATAGLPLTASGRSLLSCA